MIEVEVVVVVAVAAVVLLLVSVPVTMMYPITLNRERYIEVNQLTSSRRFVQLKLPSVLLSFAVSGSGRFIRYGYSVTNTFEWVMSMHLNAFMLPHCVSLGQKPLRFINRIPFDGTRNAVVKQWIMEFCTRFKVILLFPSMCAFFSPTLTLF